MATFDIEPLLISFGVQLASSWVNMMLYMLEIVMCFRYFQRSARPLPHKIGVGAMVFFDTLCTMSVDANILITFLSFFGKESFAALLVPTSTTIFLTYLTAIVEQLFLCHLYFILSRKRVVTLILIGLGAIHLSFSFAGGILVQTAPFPGRLTFTITAVGAILCAVNDFLIAGCLGYEMYKVKRSQSATPSLLRRLTILSITSGAIVASTTLLMMILLLKGSIAFSFFFSCQGRVYALTLLVNFLSSPSDSSSTSSSGSTKNAMVFRSGGYLNGEKKPAPSLYSHYSDESMRKELPPLPPSTPQSQTISLSSAQMVTLDFATRAQFASPTSQFASTPYSPSSSSRVVWSPQTPQTPRTIIFAPHRKSSLPV
ncbi:hypothetical protein C8F04DRAFT_1153751 [Mycena alexandri]|uniref:DUF6534 domain-containing protein n=1 Tax=Mycena alexandri TaxID=1745969 RepID=A0AAD6WMA9_9AGAR|nr:hypothetical protein C8F04DRAFT_1153751 [Mycena alexandri]